MDSEIIDAVAEWESTPVSGGYAGLHDLADGAFTGAVSEGSVWAFMLNGKVIGVFDGGIEAFEAADGTAYHAPDPALPLLYAMKVTGGETRAKYYTNDTPLSSADATLSSGSFTGYIELSENVLSGDYYVVYYGGKSMSTAYVGNGRTLLSGDEAFDRANEEVGIYEVKEVNIEITDIPEPAVDDEPIAAVDHSTPTDDDSTGPLADDSADATEAATSGDDASDEAVDVSDGSDDDFSDGSETEEPEPHAEPDRPEPVPTRDDAVSDDTSTEEPEAENEPRRTSPEPVPEEEPTANDEDRNESVAQSEVSASTGSADEDVFSEEAQWREATAIPALDPKDSATEKPESGRSAESTAPQGTVVTQRQRKRRRQQLREQSGESQSPTGDQSESQHADTAQLEAAVEATTKEKRELEAEQERIVAERDESREEVKRLQSRVSELEAEAERLESELDAVRAATSTAQSATPTETATETMTADAALLGTNLFVRYGTKSGGTLEKAHAGDVDREEVNENLRLEHHTGFETEGVAVGDVPYETFLHDSIEYGFVRWVVEDLLYEIRGTGNQGALDELFDAIPKVDRAELRGSVTLKYMENGEEHREQHSFDVVLRDRMGNPLLVANLNGSREPATEEMMTSLVENASLLRESNESLGGAFLVTASYFEPEALETAADATGGGLLGRGRRKSYVKLSRKQGFHLCLVETRNGDFHVNVPEL